MRRRSLIGFASRFIPSMSPSVHGGVHSAPPQHGLLGRILSHSPDTIQFASSSPTSKTTCTPVNPPVLLLEGDSFEVSHDGIARTFYRLTDLPGSLPRNEQVPDALLGIEEVYDLKHANKTFVIRQAQGLAPMGRALGHFEVQEIEDSVLGPAGTGGTTWESSLAMGLYFAKHPGLLKGNLLEIGSGVGVGGILSYLGSLACHPESLKRLQSVTLTDGNDQCLQQCQRNIHQAWNTLSSLCGDMEMEYPPHMHVLKLDWNSNLDISMVHHYDTILACDVCYLYPDIEPLSATIQKLLKKDGVCHLFGPYNRSAFQHLCKTLNKELLVNIESLHLERYRLRPADNLPSSYLLWGSAPPQERVYASKSQATVLHVTVRHKLGSVDDKSKEDMSDLD